MAIPGAPGARLEWLSNDGFGGVYTPQGPLKQAIVGTGEPGRSLRDIPDLPRPVPRPMWSQRLSFGRIPMSAVERLETGPTEAPSIEVELIEQPAKGRAKLRP